MPSQADDRPNIRDGLAAVSDTYRCATDDADIKIQLVLGQDGLDCFLDGGGICRCREIAVQFGSVRRRLSRRFDDSILVVRRRGSGRETAVDDEGGDDSSRIACHFLASIALLMAHFAIESNIGVHSNAQPVPTLEIYKKQLLNAHLRNTEFRKLRNTVTIFTKFRIKSGHELRE